jgi:plastocyanin
LTPFANTRVAGLCGVALLLPVVAGGCAQGRGNQPDLVNGKELFIGEGTCGSCHTLGRAGTSGTQGPSLDGAFAQARRDGLGERTIAGVVEQQIAHPRKDSIMPANLVTGDDARDVAAYVAYAAGRPGEDQGALAAAGAAQQSDEPAVAEGGSLEIPADPSGALAFTYPEAEAEAGQVEIVMPNESPVEHNIAIDGEAEGDVVGQGEESTIDVDLQPGEYEYLCTVPGHAEGGMVGTLTVE